MDLSIIIVNWNTEKITCDCIESIIKSKINASFEIIVIDNASSDNSVSVIQKKFPQVILIANDHNMGFAAANNIGMEKAKGKAILLLNSDTIVLGNVIDKTLFFLNSTNDVGVVGCKVLNEDRSLQPTCFMFPSPLNILISLFYLNKLFPYNRFFGREFLTWWKRDSIKEVDTVSGCYMLVRKDIVKEIGMMDSDFFMYAEETDWCYRFKEAGYHNYFTPSGEIIHLGGASTSMVRPKMILQLRSGILQYLNKNNSLISYRICCCLTSLWFLFRIPFWIFKCILPKSNRGQNIEILTVYVLGVFKSIIGYKSLQMKKH